MRTRPVDARCTWNRGCLRCGAARSYTAATMQRMQAWGTRRRFLSVSAAIAAGSLASRRPTAAEPVNPRLGMDNFAVRAMGWKARALVDYAASLALDSLFITDLDAFESLEDASLKTLREYASERAAADPGGHLEHLSHLEGVQAEPGQGGRAPGSWHPRRACRRVSGASGRPGHVGRPADRRRHRETHRGDNQGLPRERGLARWMPV